MDQKRIQIHLFLTQSKMESEVEDAYDEIRLLRKRIQYNSELHQPCLTKIIEITKWLAFVERGLKMDKTIYTP